MKRRSFLAFATLPLLGNFPPYFPAPKVIPKIISLSVKKEKFLAPIIDFQITQILTSGFLEPYDPTPPPEISLAAKYDDGSIRNFECSKCMWTDVLEERYSNSKCDIVGDDMVVDMSYTIKGTNETKVARCIYRDIKEVFYGD